MVYPQQNHSNVISYSRNLIILGIKISHIMQISTCFLKSKLRSRNCSKKISKSGMGLLSSLCQELLGLSVFKLSGRLGFLSIQRLGQMISKVSSNYSDLSRKKKKERTKGCLNDIWLIIRRGAQPHTQQPTYTYGTMQTINIPEIDSINIITSSDLMVSHQ